MKPKFITTLRLMITGICVVAGAAMAAPKETITIADFSGTEKVLSWQTVNDDVMGGISTSRFSIEDGIGEFRGILSLENNGGFASVRSSGKIAPLPGSQTIIVRVKGDGRQYQLRVRTSTGGKADYQAKFQTKKDEWQEHRLMLKDFVPTWRGEILKDSPQLDPASIESIGFLLGDKSPGPFALDIQWVKAA